MKRRDFFRAGIASAVSPAILKSSEDLKTNMNSPIVLSTWDFGIPANEIAIKVLKNGGSALDSAEKGARHAESDINNSSVGYGGLPDELGYVTLDACIMDSKRNAGSVAFLQNIKHPISVARMVMEKTKHVMLVGEGARKFAISNGFKETNLLTEKSKSEWKKWLKKKRKLTPHETHDTLSILVQDDKGDISGACTTSGYAFKMHGRVGDSPIIGAGLYVDNDIGCAAATGLGEEVIKTNGSFLVVELMRQGYSPQQACEEALRRIIKAHNGNPDFQIGYIALRKDGVIGSACLKWTFDYALYKNGINKLYTIEGML